MSTGCVAPSFTWHLHSWARMRMKSPLQSFLVSCLAINFLGERGVRSGRTVTPVTWGTNEKMRLQQHQKIAASKCSNYQNRRDLKYLIAPLWDYQLSERKKKKSELKTSCAENEEMAQKMVPWHLWILLSKAEHWWDKASTETLIETLAVLPDWQTSRICTCLMEGLFT